MIFLYRFEVLTQDASIAGILPPNSYTALDGIQRQLHLLTNYERAVSFGAEPFAVPFLPTGLGELGLPAAGWAFQPERIEHSGLRLDGEKAAGQLTVSLPRHHAISRLYQVESPGAQVWLTLSVAQDESDPAPLVVWVGRVRSAEYDELRCTLTLMHLGDILARPGLTAKHPRVCPFVLFDQSSCGVKVDAFDAATGYWRHREDGLLASVAANGLTITVPEAANRAKGFFDHGFVVIGGSYAEEGGELLHVPRAQGLTPSQATAASIHGGVRRAIMAHDGQTLTLAGPLPVGDYTTEDAQRVSLFAGCDGAKTTCQSKFSNFKRYGGYPYIPIKNPFESGLK